MTLMLCVDEPFASAIFAGLKTWETRPSPPNGEMRPEGVRGFPGSRLARGERIIIASTQRRPRHEQRNVNDDLPPWCDLYSFARHVEWTEHGDFHHGGAYRWVGPVEVILGTVAVTGAAPIVADCDDLDGAPELIETFGGLLRWWPECAATTDESRDISDQLPWGDWTPGRWAWKLTDPKPTTEQCPNDCARFDHRVPGHTMGSNWYWVPCPVCNGKGKCSPIPARGHQGLRPFTPEALR